MKERALGCVNSPPQPEGARRRDSRNLGTSVSTSRVKLQAPKLIFLVRTQALAISSFSSFSLSKLFKLGKVFKLFGKKSSPISILEALKGNMKYLDSRERGQMGMLSPFLKWSLALLRNILWWLIGISFPFRAFSAIGLYITTLRTRLIVYFQVLFHV